MTVSVPAAATNSADGSGPGADEVKYAGKKKGFLHIAPDIADNTNDGAVELDRSAAVALVNHTRNRFTRHKRRVPFRSIQAQEPDVTIDRQHPDPGSVYVRRKRFLVPLITARRGAERVAELAEPIPV
jgi:hypothetical protein